MRQTIAAPLLLSLLLLQCASTLADDAEPTWKLAAIDKFGGEFTVGVVTKKNKFLMLKIGQRTPEGIWIKEVRCDGVIADAEVVITDGKRETTLAFDSKRLAPPPRRSIKTAITPRRLNRR